jgi:hypothetical protein
MALIMNQRTETKKSNFFPIFIWFIALPISILPIIQKQIVDHKVDKVVSDWKESRWYNQEFSKNSLTNKEYLVYTYMKSCPLLTNIDISPIEAIHGRNIFWPDFSKEKVTTLLTLRESTCSGALLQESSISDDPNLAKDVIEILKQKNISVYESDIKVINRKS